MKTCLVVDDAPFDQKLLAICASKMGFKVITACSGKEALGFCNTALPDCVLLDWEMPEINGIELLKKLRKMDGGEHLPIIICTSHEHASFIGHAYVHGASGYIQSLSPPTSLKINCLS